jgi:hypothetical protein
MKGLRLAVALSSLLALLSCGAGDQFSDDFNAAALDPAKWVTTKDGDFAELAVDVSAAEAGVGRLRLRAGTRGCTDPMKYLGVRSVSAFPTVQGLEVAFDLDWNQQANGCYLSAGVYLCPEAGENPQASTDWVCLEYVGVPPGKTVRTNLWVQRDSRLQTLYTDWGPRDEKGRPLGRELEPGPRRLRLIVTPTTVQAFDGDQEIVPATPYECGFDQAYMYLQMSSGTNYPPREVFLDNVVVRTVAGG